MQQDEFKLRRSRAYQAVRDMLQITEQPSPFDTGKGGAEHQTRILQIAGQNGKRQKADDDYNRPLEYILRGLERSADTSAIWKVLMDTFVTYSMRLTDECYNRNEKEELISLNWTKIFQLANSKDPAIFHNRPVIARALQAVYGQFWN